MKTEIKIERRNNRTSIVGYIDYDGTMRPVYSLSKRDDENEWIRSLATCPVGSLEEGKTILLVSLQVHEFLEEKGSENINYIWQRQTHG